MLRPLNDVVNISPDGLTIHL